PLPPFPTRRSSDLGKGDPLAGFTYAGPARPLVAVLWLLARHPIMWLVPALIWMVAWPFTLAGGTVALVASVAQYTALIAAGWIGWQRPWLFGVAAVLVGWGAVAWFFVQYGTRSGLMSPNQVLVALASKTALQLVVGFVAGWFVFAVIFVQFWSLSCLLSPNQVLVALASQTALQLVVGFVAGWYGGYLRRRLADQRPRPAAARGRRR